MRAPAPRSLAMFPIDKGSECFAPHSLRTRVHDQLSGSYCTPAYLLHWRDALTHARVFQTLADSIFQSISPFPVRPAVAALLRTRLWLASRLAPSAPPRPVSPPLLASR